MSRFHAPRVSRCAASEAATPPPPPPAKKPATASQRPCVTCPAARAALQKRGAARAEAAASARGECGRGNGRSGEGMLPTGDKTCPVSTEGGTRRIQLVREGGGEGMLPTPDQTRATSSRTRPAPARARCRPSRGVAQTINPIMAAQSPRIAAQPPEMDAQPPRMEALSATAQPGFAGAARWRTWPGAGRRRHVRAAGQGRASGQGETSRCRACPVGGRECWM
jgi:hypothetical protein